LAEPDKPTDPAKPETPQPIEVKLIKEKSTPEEIGEEESSYHDGLEMDQKSIEEFEDGT